jgi:hypothetical protein
VTPKAELHVHLEGTAPPELVRRIARRNNLNVPDGTIGVDGRYLWDDFLHFLRVYDQAASVIRSAQDYRDITFEYLTGVRARGRDLCRADRLTGPRGAGRPAVSRPDRRIAQGSTTPATSPASRPGSSSRRPQLRHRAAERVAAARRRHPTST